MERDVPSDLRIHHVGIVVDDLRESIAFMRDVLGLEAEDVLDLGPGQVAWVRCGTVMLELLQYSDPARRRERLGDAPAVIEHIAFHTDDADATYAELAAKGVTFEGPPRVWKDRKSFFTKPESCDGVMYQFREPITDPAESK